jgi:hypothetical protein
MELLGILTAFGLSASSGLNAYIPLLVVALLGRFTDLIALKSPYDTLTNGWVIGVLVVLTAIEFFADKVPAVNHANDVLQTFVRPVAGAVVFAASARILTDINPVIALAAGLLIAGGVHTVKAAAVRPVVTATTGGAGNVPVSILEDVISTTLAIMAIVVPILLGSVMVLFSALLIWLLWRRANRQRIRQTA